MAKKYIDADRLSAEVEKRKKANQQDASEGGAGAFYEDKAVLKLIDSLQQEPLIGIHDIGLEGEKGADGSLVLQEMEGFFRYSAKGEKQVQPCGDLKIALIQQEITRLYDKYSGKNILGPECIVLDKLDEFIDTLKEKSSSIDLDEEIKRYIPRDQCPVPDFMEAVARHFAEWQKEQMIRDCSVQASYEAEIEKAEERGYNLCKEQMLKDAVEGIAHPDDCEIWVNLVGYGYKFNDGDKVKIIIVKED